MTSHVRLSPLVSFSVPAAVVAVALALLQPACGEVGSATGIVAVDSGADMGDDPCRNARIDFGETDVDCGSACPTRCGEGKRCTTRADCAAGQCNNGRCTATCDDAMQDGQETDIDCGGACPNRCADTKSCSKADDCVSGVCQGGRCSAASCTDSVKNGSEVDIDCGQGCPSRCANGKACATSADCTSGVCASNVCVAPGCADSVKNGLESDVDCGGTVCAGCGVGKGCGSGADCASGVCSNGSCAAPSCADSVKNGSESDVDCGGSCSSRCASSKRCNTSADCVSGVCTGGTCRAPSCSDGVKNGGESDVDCGASCSTKCAIGRTCNSTADCDASACVSNLCFLPSSCSALVGTGTPSGVLMVDPDGNGPLPARSVFCEMSADGGGFTLALKVDGSQNNYLYHSPRWTDETLQNETSLAIDTTEAKLRPFLDTPFTAIRVGLRDPSDQQIRWLVLPVSGTSLRALFQGGYVATNLGRSAWEGLLATSSLQPNCNREGINANPTGDGGYDWAKARIGISSNQEADCGTPDSWIGLGTGPGDCSGGRGNFSAGNLAVCTGDNGDIERAAFGYVMIR